MRTITSVMALVALVAILTPLYANAEQVPQPPTKFQQFQINGAGATFPFPLIDLWRVEYNKLYSNVDLNYQSIGSGGGVKQHIEKTVDFTGTDAPLTTSERELAPKTLHIPEAIGGVTVVYNIPEIPNKGLKLTGNDIADIYLGKIKKWNDPKIAQNNPGVVLPNTDIVPVRRSDGSGTTFVFTDYLSTVSSEFEKTVGKGKSVQWPVGLGAAGNEGVAGTVRSTTYSIGYVELAYAFQTGMSFAFVQNGDKTAFIEPSLDSISAASAGVASTLPKAEADWGKVTLVNAPGKGSYPIASFTYLLVYENLEQSVKSKDQAKALVHMIHWMITDGQKHSSKLLYVPLSDPVKEIGKQALGRVKYNGETLFQYSGLISSNTSSGTSPESTYEIPQWIRNTAKWWADGQISDSEYIKSLQYLISRGILKV